MIWNIELIQNIPIGSGNINHLTTTVGPDKFPHFPGSLKDEKSNIINDVPRPERALHTIASQTSPPVFKEGDTLYRAKSDVPKRDQPKPKLERPSLGDKKHAPVHVSSLPVTTSRPGTIYSSPLYSKTQFYTTKTQ